MKHGSLFSGIGGFDLAARWCGWDNVFQVEKDEFCQQVLAKNFPETKRYKDIRNFDGSKYCGSIDIVSGGFPCQPFSVAGKRKGTADDRHLWPEMLRIIREIKPCFVVGENVGGFVTWENGMVFDQTLSDLENEGCEVGTFIIPACAVNAPHRRDRVWIIAHYQGKNDGGNIRDQGTRQKPKPRDGTIEDISAHDNGKRAQGIVKESIPEFPELSWREDGRGIENICGRSHVPQPLVRGNDDGFPYRIHRTKALGNAIVPQVAYQIFQSLIHLSP